MSIEALLHVEIAEEFEKLNTMEVGTEQYKTTVDGLTKLLDKAIECERLDMEATENRRNNDLKEAEMKEDRKDRLVKNILTGASIAVPSLITIWGTIKSINFEKEGTITTIMGRGFIQKLLPKK